MIGCCSGTHISNQGYPLSFAACSDERRFAKRAPKVRCSERTADCFALLKINFGRTTNKSRPHRNRARARLDNFKNRRKLNSIRTESRFGNMRDPRSGIGGMYSPEILRRAVRDYRTKILPSGTSSSMRVAFAGPAPIQSAEI
jgi:hypothetical protein